MKTKIGILIGGTSNERAVSFLSAENILNLIDEQKYDVTAYEIPEDGNPEWIVNLIKDKPSFILNLLHGGNGENGSVQGVLNCIGIDYFGSGVLGSALCMNKNMSKIVMKSLDIPVIDGIFIRKDDEIAKYKKNLKQTGYPLIVKPNCGGSSIGIKVASNFEELSSAAEEIKKTGDDILIEKYIKGREITCCVIKRKDKINVMPIPEINPKSEIYDYEAKYGRENESINFSTLPQFMKKMITEIAKKTFSGLDCSDYATVDMIISEEQVYVIEVNTIPGLTKNSLIPKSVEVSGTMLKTFVNSLLP